MTTIPTGLAINSSVPADRTTASGMRKVLAAMLQQSSAGVPLTGILYAFGNPLTVTPHASLMQYSVSPGYAVTTRTGQGAYIVGSTTTTTVATTAANATNPRYDVIYIVQPDPELAESGVARIDVVNGTPAASPTVPAIPTGALELGRKLVPAGAANTATGTAISNRPGYVGSNADWNTLPSKPSAFNPSPHNHSTSDLTAGVLPVSRGGTDVTNYDDITKMISSMGLPYRQAAGRGSNSGASWATITFPAGRFNVAPIITGGSESITNAQPVTVNVGAISSTSMLCAGFKGDSAVTSTWYWQATQMTPTSAAG